MQEQRESLMDANFTLSEREAWLDGWIAAGEDRAPDKPPEQHSAESTAFAAGWEARLKHKALDYADDVPLPEEDPSSPISTVGSPRSA